MEPKQEDQKPSRAELETIVSELRALVGDRLRNHKEGDAERLLFKIRRRRGAAMPEALRRLY